MQTFCYYPANILPTLRQQTAGRGEVRGDAASVAGGQGAAENVSGCPELEEELDDDGPIPSPREIAAYSGLPADTPRSPGEDQPAVAAPSSSARTNADEQEPSGEEGERESLVAEAGGSEPTEES